MLDGRGAGYASPVIQIVCIKWGAKYGIDAVNRIHRTVRRGTRAALRFVLIADTVDEGLDPEIEVQPFPPFPVPFDLMKEGCRLKLAMFAPGVLDPDLPTVYFDLDTVVRGDVQRIADQLERVPALYMLQNHYIQFWRYQSLLKLIGSKLFYYGNSSVLAFHPGRFAFIYEKFCGLISTAPRSSQPRQMKKRRTFHELGGAGAGARLPAPARGEVCRGIHGAMDGGRGHPPAAAVDHQTARQPRRHHVRRWQP